MPKTGDVLFVEHQKSVLHQIWNQIRIPRTLCTLKRVKSVFYYMEMPNPAMFDS